MKLRIVEASERVLIEQGLEGWTVEGVAREAGCAKGLVHYHHRTKGALLIATPSPVSSEETVASVVRSPPARSSISARATISWTTAGVGGVGRRRGDGESGIGRECRPDRARF